MCVCVCVCVCLSICREDRPISGNTRDLYQFFVHVAYDRGLILLGRCDTLRTTGFMDDIMFFFYNGPYSGMNFATKDRFRVNLLIYRNFGQNSIVYY